MNNSKNAHSPLLLIIPLLLITMVLEIMRLPGFLQENRPDFPVIILVFFSAVLRNRTCIELAWLTGLALDLLTGSPLGINALTFCAQVYIIAWQFKKFHTYSLWEQTIVVGCVALVIRTVGYWLAHVILQTSFSLNIIYPSLVMAVLWFVCCPLFKVITESLTGKKIASNNEAQ